MKKLDLEEIISRNPRIDGPTARALQKQLEERQGPSRPLPGKGVKSPYGRRPRKGVRWLNDDEGSIARPHFRAL